METLIKKAVDAGLDVRRINQNQLAYAKYLLHQYSDPALNLEDEMEFKPSPRNAEFMALRYLELVSQSGYWKREQIELSDRFKKVETRGRPPRKFEQEQIAQANAYFAQGKSADEVANLLNITLFAATKLRCKAVGLGIVKVTTFERRGRPYLKNNGKRELIKQFILENPELSFNKIELANRSCPQLVKLVWLEMVASDEICSLLKYKHKFVGNRNFADIEEHWIKDKFKSGYAIESIASAIKGTALKVEKVLCFQRR